MKTLSLSLSLLMIVSILGVFAATTVMASHRTSPYLATITIPPGAPQPATGAICVPFVGFDGAPLSVHDNDAPTTFNRATGEVSVQKAQPWVCDDDPFFFGADPNVVAVSSRDHCDFLLRGFFTDQFGRYAPCSNVWGFPGQELRLMGPHPIIPSSTANHIRLCHRIEISGQVHETNDVGVPTYNCQGAPEGAQ